MKTLKTQMFNFNNSIISATNVVLLSAPKGYDRYDLYEQDCEFNKTNLINS